MGGLDAEGDDPPLSGDGGRVSKLRGIRRVCEERDRPPARAQGASRSRSAARRVETATARPESRRVGSSTMSGLDAALAQLLGDDKAEVGTG
jgi:hypothetical protein